MNIWVISGGTSKEREVSLRSGQGIVKALQTNGHKVRAVQLDRNSDLIQLPWTAERPDYVFIALHGTFGEDGTLQGFLDTVGVPYNGSGVHSSSLCFHKGHTKKHLKAFGLPLPDSHDVVGVEGFAALEKRNALPKNFYASNWFLKPAREGSTIGLERYRGSDLNSRDQFLKLLSQVVAYDPYVLIEEWVDGRELTVPIFFGKAMPIVEIRPLSQFYDYESKYTKGKTEYLCPAPLEAPMAAKIAKLAEDAFSLLENQDYARIDVMLGAQGPQILEMNTLPGMTETSLVPKSAAAMGLSYAEFVEQLVQGSLKRQKK
jgi:D-alanine-D-alanine ligase